MRPKSRSALLTLLMISAPLLCAQIRNPGFTGITETGDTLFWQPVYRIPGAPASDSLRIEMAAPSSLKNKPAFYDPRAVMPKNRLFLDTRGSSYYVPRQVGDQLAHIMNRPSSNEVAPVFAAAVLAARIASQYIDIGFELELKAADYLLDETYFPILKSLWKRFPQTVFELYQDETLKNGRTVVVLKKELARLSALNIVKVTIQEKAPRLYYPAQKKEDVKILLSEALKKERLLPEQKNKLIALIHIIDSLK